jgi:hypothetical protein
MMLLVALLLHLQLLLTMLLLSMSMSYSSEYAALVLARWRRDTRCMPCPHCRCASSVFVAHACTLQAALGIEEPTR